MTGALRSPATTRAPRRGFTLIELVVVLVILSVMLAVVAPALSRGRERTDLERGVEAVAELLRRTRATAIDRARPATLVLDPGAARYWVSAPRDEPPAPQFGARSRFASFGDDPPEAAPPPADTVIAEGALELPAGVAVETGGAPRARATFYPTGAAVADRLTVRGADAAVALAVDPWTGDVHDGRP